MPAPTIIDSSETVPLLTVLAGAKLRIQHDQNTPDGTDQVRVSLKGLTLGLGSSIFVHHNAELILDNVVTADLAGKLAIGGGGKLFLDSSIGLNVLDKIRFRPSTQHAVLLINTSNVLLSGAISGFGLHDTILLGNLGAVSAMWNQTSAHSGTLDLFGKNGTEVGSINLNGHYTTANFSVRDAVGSQGSTTTNISYVATDSQPTAVWTTLETHGGPATAWLHSPVHGAA